MRVEIPQPLLQQALTDCKAEIDVLNELSLRYAESVEAAASEDELQEKAQYVLHCNDILYKKLVFECGLSFEQGEALVEDLNFKALKSANSKIVAA